MGIRPHGPMPPSTTNTRPATSTASSTSGSNWTGDIIHVPKETGVKAHSVDNLPYGRGGGRLWHAEYTPHILAWAGSQEDPFTVNNHTSLRDEMAKMWEQVFPMNPLNKADIDFLEKTVSLSCRNVPHLLIVF